MVEDIAWVFGAADNVEAEALLRRRLARERPLLLRKLELGSDAEFLDVHGPWESLVSLARFIHRLSLVQPTPRPVLSRAVGRALRR